MKKNRTNYLIIILYGLLLTFLLLGFNNLYGSTTDWLSQHSVIPEYFRNLFYETKNLLPNFAFNLGAGQNIFNFSYYGVLSPVILISYFLPFLNMTTYIIIASIFLYILSGLLLYHFLQNHKYKNSTCLLLSLIILTLPPMYHFHHHIMFIWYMPFLILSYIGVDRYVEKNKSLLLMLSIFLIIMTNYYYSVVCILSILVYGVYRLLDKDNFKFKTFLLDVLKASIRIIIPIMMAGLLLLPTANVITKTGRELTHNINYFNLLIPNLNEIVYKAFSMGLTGIFLIAPFSLLINKKKKPSDIFLGISLILITFIPLFMYGLNGFLYIRGKVLIPFIVLYIFVLSKFINNLKNNQLDLKKLTIICILLIFLILLINHNYLMLFLALDILISLITIKLFVKYKNEMIIYLPLLFILLIAVFVNNKEETYVTIQRYKEINNKDITKLIENIEDDSLYRTDNYLYPSDLVNKNYNSNYYSPNIYSSNYNNYYRDFYNFKSGNNIAYRNGFITTGANNLLFNTLMGVKYVVSKNDLGLGYDKIDSIGDINLYYNSQVYPLVYETSSVGSLEEYEKLKFPYNLEYMLKFPVTKNDILTDYEVKTNKLNLDIDSKYDFKLNKTTKYDYKLPEAIENKILIISFNMDYSQSCSEGDTSITINGVKNKLTCRSWMYHNNNYKFEYVLAIKELTDTLNIEISKGKYKLSNIEFYELDYEPIKFNELNNLKIDKKKSVITGFSDLKNAGYIITSIPYDEGFKVYVDEAEAEKEIVNTSFLGFKVPEGEHEIRIVYNSPWLKYGYALSLLGFISLIMILIYEKYQKFINNLLLKNKEIISYLIFGVLTTVVSLLSYYVLTKTILNPSNDIELQIANIISWIISVTFAYITNRLFVFTSDNKEILKEAFKFYESRLLTLFADMGLMYIFVSCLKYNDSLIKLITQVIVIIANYILSKLIVFKKKGSK